MEEETTGLNKEIQNLLENVDNSAIGGSKSWRTYARLVLPHVGLVVFVCFYALLGAWIFYSIESPHEDRLKVQGVRQVQELRRQLMKDILGMNAADFGQNWIGNTENQLRKFGEDLFRAYKEQYVRFENVRSTILNATKSSNSTSNQPAQPVVFAQMDPRFRRHFSKSRSEGKMWTPSSALFFAATTMATIGYGNIVPMTNQGRIACIIFALFGAPLAIITIGDLGKFLSECTIWMYRRIKDKSRLLHFQICQYWISRRKRRRRRLKEHFISDELAMDGNLEMGDQIGEGNAEDQLKEKSNGDGDMAQQKEIDKRRVAEAERERRINEWEEEEKLETEVPVLVVFAILLFYIAFGGVLFAFLESWTYMDAFYYCFVSLTTIGFGDLVPDRHEYIVLMLLYLGIGLAVTTMCIDLVGVQYIQKIHYFGRKFKGTDIMKILKRQRMMERRLAMGEGKEFIEFVMIKQQEREALSIPAKAFVQPGVVHLASQLYGHEPQEDEKISLRSEAEWPMEELVVQDVIPSNELVLAHSLRISEILEQKPLVRRLSSPIVSPSSESERSIMYKRLLSGRIDSWCESGPSISINSALSTEPSVQQREEFYTNYRSPEPSPTSFAFSFPPPSPDLWKIADAARSSRRLASCPALPPYTDEPVSQYPRLWRKWRTLASPSRAFYELLRFSKRCVVVVLPFQSLSRRFSQTQPWEYEGHNHRPRLGTNGLDVGENWGEEAAAESIHHLDVFEGRVSFFKNQAEILQAPKAPPLRFISQPVWYYRRRRSLHQQQECPITIPSFPPHSISEQSNPPAMPSISQKATLPLEAYQPILKRKRRERLARKFDPLLRFDWLALSPRIAVTEEGGRPATMEEISERADELLKMEDLPKQLASEHPIYQHLANLESTADFGSNSPFDQSQTGDLSSRLLIGQGKRFSLESLAFGLKAARRWKERTKKREQESISTQGQGPSNSKSFLPQMKWLMESPRRTSLGGGQLSNLSKELPFGIGRKIKEIVKENRMDTEGKKIDLTVGKQYSPTRQQASIVGERSASMETSSSVQWRQMSIDIGGQKMPSPIRRQQRVSVAEERRMGTGGICGSLVPSGNELRQKMPTKTLKESTVKRKPEGKQQQQRKGLESSKRKEANQSTGK